MKFSGIINKMNDIIKVNELRSEDYILDEFEKLVYSELNINSNDINSSSKYMSPTLVSFLRNRSITIKSKKELLDLIRQLSLSYIEGDTDMNCVKKYITLNEYFKDKEKVIDHFTNFKNMMSSRK